MHDTCQHAKPVATVASDAIAPLRRSAAVVRAACILLALAALAPATPIQAQVRTYLSTLGNTIDGSEDADDKAQAFRTGSQSGGYPLSSVILDFESTTNDDFVVRITTSRWVGGIQVPSSRLHLLTHPESLKKGENTFTAPSGATLQPNTTYFVVMSASGPFANSPGWRRAVRSEADVEKLTGWHMNFDYLYDPQSQPGGYLVKSDRVFLVAIKGDLPLPSLTVSQGASVTEGEEAAFTLRRRGRDTSSALTVNYRVSENGAMVAAADEGDKTISFASGDTRKTVTVPTEDDDIKEADSLVTLELTEGMDYTLGSSASATATVEDDDGPRVGVERVSSSVGEGADAQFRVERTGGTMGPLTVRYEVSENGDMVAAGEEGSKTIDFADEATSVTITVPTVQDGVQEADSVVTVTLTADDAYDIDAATATVTVRDAGGRQLPTVTVSRVSSSVGEGADARFRLRRSGAAAGALTVRYRVSESGAMVAPGDEGAKSVVLRSGETSRDVAVRTQDDGASEPDSGVTLRLTADASYRVGSPSSATVRVRDDDGDDGGGDDGGGGGGGGGGGTGGGPPTVSVQRLSLSVDEGADARFRLRRSGATAGALTVRYGVSESGDMVAPGDEGAKSVVLSSGETSREVSVPTQDDNVSEADSEVTLRLAADAAYRIGSPSSATVLVADDEPPLPTLTVERVRSAVDEGRSAQFRLLRADVAEGALTVHYRVSESGDMVAPGDEGAKVVELRDGSTRANLNVPTVDDGFSEADSVVTLALEADAVYILGSPPSAAVTVRDDDEGAPPPPTAATMAVMPYLPPASAPGLEGFVRIVNHSGEAGEVSIEAIDDAGVSAGTVALPIAANATAQFNVPDLERGNPGKGVAEGVGAGQGGWRLSVRSALPITALAYVRAADGLVSPLHDVAPADGDGRHVAFFNPAGNLAQVSSLRLVNLGGREAQVTVVGADSAGETSASATVALPAGGATELTAAELEAAIGDGRGKWRLAARSDEPILAMSLLSSPTGHLTNLSTVPARPGPGGAHVVPLFLSASDAFGRQGFVRVVNRSAEAGEVTITAHDDSDFAYAPVTLAIGAGRSAHFNSLDLELGNAAKGLTGSTGPSAAGDWRLELRSALDIDVLAYARTSDGFLTSVHDLAPTLADGSHWVAFFNPASNADQVSSLRLVNRGMADARATVTGVDARGDSPGGAVTLMVPAGASRTVSAAELENGAEGLEGALGDGRGKWRLRVVSDRPILVMSLLASPAGHLVNISGAPGRGVR